MPHSHASGAAVTGPPGSLGISVNGDRSISTEGHSSEGPNSAITPVRASTLQARAVASHGSRPNNATASAASTRVAGHRASAAPSSCGTCVLIDPVRRP